MTEAKDNQIATSRKLAVANSVSSVLTHIISLTVLVWLQQFLLSRVSAAEYELFPLLMAPMVFIPLITTILTAGLGRYSVDAYAKGDKNRVTAILSTMTPLLFGAALIVALIGVLGIWQIDNIIKVKPEYIDDARWMMAILVTGAITRVAFAAFGLGIFIKQKFIHGNLIDLGSQALRLILLAALFSGFEVRVVWVVLATTLANTTGFFLRLWISRRLVPELVFRRSSIDWSIAPEIASFGSWTFVQQTATAMRLSVSLLLLNHFAAPGNLICFYLGSLVLKQVQRLMITALRPLAPPLVAMWALGEIDRIRAVYLNGCRYALWLAMLATCPVLIFGPNAMRLYLSAAKDVDIELTIQVMLIIILVLPIRFSNIMMGRIATSAGMAKEACFLVLANHSSVVAVMAILIIGFDMGALGAAIASLSVVMVMAPILSLPFAFKITQLCFSRWLKETVIPGVLPGLIASMVWMPLFFYFEPATWLSLAACGFPGLLVFGLVVVRFSMKEHERRDIATIIGKVKNKLIPTT